MNKSILFSDAFKKSSLIVNYQSVRWRRPRKPFWLGLAKSKMFVIRKPKRVLTSEENQTWMSLKFNYETYNKSLLNFIRNEDPRLKEEAGIDDELNITCPALEEKISFSLKVNEEFNAESKKLGEKWKEKTLAEETEKAQKLILENQKIRESQLKIVDEIVRKEKALSESYITPENIDEAIEKCLKNIEEFDFAIDLQGNKYYGRETLEKGENQIGKKESVVIAKGNKQINQAIVENSERL